MKVTIEMSMSLDGFVTDPNPGAGLPHGDPGRLHDWMFDAKTDDDAAVVDDDMYAMNRIIAPKRLEPVVEPEIHHQEFTSSS